jgi:hypothetical protein
VLDILEQRLEIFRSSLTGKRVDLPIFFFPADLGPIPAKLLPRAVELLSAQHDVENAIRDRMLRIASALNPKTERRSLLVDASS